MVADLEKEGTDSIKLKVRSQKSKGEIMSRYTGPKCRLCRLEGVKLFLKGSRCETEKCALTRKQTAPGMHQKAKRVASDYKQHLREKQKVKRIYGLFERQFRRFFTLARRSKGATGEVLLKILESRLDNLVYRLGLAASRSSARQLVTSGKILVNGKKAAVPSIILKKGDIIAPASEKIIQIGKEIPSWLSWDEKKKEGVFLRVPDRSELDSTINEHLIVEFYSR